MPAFKYKGIIGEKNTYTDGVIEAINEDEAAFRLREQKIIIISLAKSKKKSSSDSTKKKKNSDGEGLLSKIPFLGGGSVKPQEVMLFSKKIATMTKNIDWDKMRGMILMNHGVFSFGDNAKQSYDRMIQIVTKAEDYLKSAKVFRKYHNSNSKADLLALARIRKKASQMAGKPYIALLNDSTEAVGFSTMKAAKNLSLKIMKS